MKIHICVAFAAISVAFPACSNGGGAEAFCDAARSLNNFDKEAADLDELRGLVADLVEAAPAEIEDSAREFGDGIEAAMTGDFEQARGQDFATAGDEIQEYMEENCSDEG